MTPVEPTRLSVTLNAAGIFAAYLFLSWQVLSASLRPRRLCVKKGLDIGAYFSTRDAEDAETHSLIPEPGRKEARAPRREYCRRWHPFWPRQVPPRYQRIPV